MATWHFGIYSNCFDRDRAWRGQLDLLECVRFAPSNDFFLILCFLIWRFCNLLMVYQPWHLSFVAMTKMSLIIGEQSTPWSNELDYRSKTCFLQSTGNPFSHKCLCNPELAIYQGVWSVWCLIWLWEVIRAWSDLGPSQWSPDMRSALTLVSSDKHFLCIFKPFPIKGNIPTPLKVLSSIEKSRLFF